MKTQWHIWSMSLDLPFTLIYILSAKWVKINNIVYIFATKYIFISILIITKFLLAFIWIYLCLVFQKIYARMNSFNKLPICQLIPQILTISKTFLKFYIIKVLKKFHIICLESSDDRIINRTGPPLFKGGYGDWTRLYFFTVAAFNRRKSPTLR